MFQLSKFCNIIYTLWTYSGFSCKRVQVNCSISVHVDLLHLVLNACLDLGTISASPCHTDRASQGSRVADCQLPLTGKFSFFLFFNTLNSDHDIKVQEFLAAIKQMLNDPQRLETFPAYDTDSPDYIKAGPPPWFEFLVIFYFFCTMV